MDNDITFSSDEMHALLDYIAEKYQRNPKIEPNTFTTREWAEHHHISMKTAREHLRALVRSGAVEPAQKLDRQTIHRKWIQVDGYRFTKKVVQ